MHEWILFCVILGFWNGNIKTKQIWNKLDNNKYSTTLVCTIFLDINWMFSCFWSSRSRVRMTIHFLHLFHKELLLVVSSRFLLRFRRFLEQWNRRDRKPHTTTTGFFFFFTDKGFGPFGPFFFFGFFYNREVKLWAFKLYTFFLFFQL